jgi:hypothetical protein
MGDCAVSSDDIDKWIGAALDDERRRRLVVRNSSTLGSTIFSYEHRYLWIPEHRVAFSWLT